MERLHSLATPSGHDNTANGDQALLSNTTGDSSTQQRYWALRRNTAGSQNTATGAVRSLQHVRRSTRPSVLVRSQDNTTGSSNIALGTGAAINVTTANNVICIGATW